MRRPPLSEQNSSYQWQGDPTVGIQFVWKDKSDVLFAPYSFMSQVRLKDDNTIIFEYSFGKITVSGRLLHEIFAWIPRLGICAIIELPASTCYEEAWVRSIRFESTEEAGAVEPVFPRKR